MTDEQQLSGAEARTEIARKMREVADKVESDAAPTLAMRDCAESVTVHGTQFSSPASAR